MIFSPLIVVSVCTSDPLVQYILFLQNCDLVSMIAHLSIVTKNRTHKSLILFLECVLSLFMVPLLYMLELYALG